MKPLHEKKWIALVIDCFINQNEQILGILYSMMPKDSGVEIRDSKDQKQNSIVAYFFEKDHKLMEDVKKAVKIPVIGNGDIRQPKDAQRMFNETFCDAVMVGRGALGNPWIFKGIAQTLNGEVEDYLPSLEQRKEMIENHWEMEANFIGDKNALKSFHKHILWYTKGLDNSHRFRETAGKLKDEENLLSELNEYFRSLSHDAN